MKIVEKQTMEHADKLYGCWLSDKDLLRRVISDRYGLTKPGRN